MIQKIIIFLILALIIWGGWRVTQNASYSTQHDNADGAVRAIGNLPGL